MRKWTYPNLVFDSKIYKKNLDDKSSMKKRISG